jgi:outer membrane receptor for ferrienterochelin and colicin
MRWILAVPLSSALLTAQANDDKAPTPQQVVVNGGKSDVEKSRDFVAGKLIIGKQRIAESGLPTAGELLRREPAISVGKDGRIGMLGLPGYTQVLVDGQPYPQGDPFAIDLVEIERIEIIKSATAATGPFGIAGTINIIRRKADRKALTTLRAGVTTKAGHPGADIAWSNNQVAADGAFSYNLSLSARYVPMPVSSQYVEAREAPGVAPQAVFDGTVSGSGDTQTVTVAGDFAWKVGADHKLGFRPNATGFKVPAESQEQRRWENGNSLLVRQRTDASFPVYSLPLRWNWQLDEDSALAVNMSMNHILSSNAVSRLESGIGVPGHDRSHRRDDQRTNYFLDVDFNTEVKGGHAITAGAKLVRNEANATYADFIDGAPDLSLAALGHESSIRSDSMRLFAQDDWRIDRTLALNLGLSAEHRNYEIVEGPVRNRTQFNLWSPSVHVAKKIGGNSKRQFRVSLARTFQQPLSDQLLLHPSIDAFAPCPSGGLCGSNTIDTADRSGNPRLLPERALGLNASYTHGVGKSSELALEVYTRDIRNKIGWEIASENVAWANAARYVLRPANLGEARVRGVNLEGRFAGKDIWKAAPDIELHGSLGFARSELSDIPGPDNRIAGQTPWRAKLGGSYSMTAVPLKWGFEANYLPGDWVRGSLNTRAYESNRETLDLNASWKLSAKSRLLINLDNLLHKTNHRIDDYLEASDVLRLSTRSADYARFAIRFETTL